MASSGHKAIADRSPVGDSAPVVRESVMHDQAPELSDLVIDYDTATCVRRPVHKSRVREVLRAHDSRWALRILERFPATDDVLDAPFVNGALVRAHLELQRLHEEFLVGLRVLEVLGPLIRAIRSTQSGQTIRVVDLGCGLGFVVRWLACHGALGDDVTLCGADFNAVFIKAGRTLASQEGLRCELVVGNAFRLDAPATIYMSTGVLHHFRGEALTAVFAQQAQSPTQAFVHFDIKPSLIAPVGSFIFHRARMREPLAQYDGYQSAVRAHSEDTLREAARVGAEGFRHAIFDGRVGALRLVRIMHAVVGVRPELEHAFVRELARDARRLSSMEGR